MNAFKQLPSMVALVAAGTLTLSTSASGAETAREKAQALLQDVKKHGLERQIAGKQTELDRLSEDLSKGEKESGRLRESIESVGSTIKESSTHLDQLTGQRDRLAQVLDLVGLRIEAERLKVEGLRMLSDAQTKALAAVAKQNDEINLRAALGSAELKLLTPGELPPIAEGNAEAPNVPKLKSEVPDLRKKLEKSEQATLTAEKAAREAMRAATRQLQLAESAAARASKKAVDLGMEGTPDALQEVEPIRADAPKKSSQRQPGGAPLTSDAEELQKVEAR